MALINKQLFNVKVIFFACFETMQTRSQTSLASIPAQSTSQKGTSKRRSKNSPLPTTTSITNSNTTSPLIHRSSTTQNTSSQHHAAPLRTQDLPSQRHVTVIPDEINSSDEENPSSSGEESTRTPSISSRSSSQVIVDVITQTADNQTDVVQIPLLVPAQRQKSTIPRKPRALTSSVWQFFDPESKDANGYVYCRICKAPAKNSGGNTTGMGNHIRDFHKDMLEVNDVTGISMDETRQRLLHLIVRFRIPLEILHDDNLHELLSKRPELYRRISVETMKQELSLTCIAVNEKMIEALSHALSVVIAVDGWTSKAFVGYLSTFLQFLDEEMRLHKMTIYFADYDGRHTGVNIASVVQESLASVGLTTENVKAYVTDNASNMKASAKILRVTFAFLIDQY